MTPIAVIRARRLIRRALLRSCLISHLSLNLSSPASMLRTPRAASAIQVFSRACSNPNPANQTGKKITTRSKRGASMTTSAKAVPTPTLKATMPSSRRLRCSRAPILIASRCGRFISSPISAESCERLPGCDLRADLCANHANCSGGRSIGGHDSLGRFRGCLV